MSILSAHCWCYPPTTRDMISLLNRGGFGTQFVIPQEKKENFKNRFHHSNIECLQEYQHKVMKKHMNKKHGVLRTYSLKDGDTRDVRISKFDEHKDLLVKIFEFSRPYALLAVTMSLTSISILPLNSWAQVTPYFLVESLKGIVPFLFISFYSVAVNQISDLEIDKINKPSLPLAAGAFSNDFAWRITVASLIMGLGLGIKFGSPASFTGLALWAFFLSLYSIELPYMRWKRNPFLAAICIAFPRSIFVQLGYFIHIQKYVLREPIVFSRRIIFAIPFVFILFSVIAVFKDIPDVDGDKLHGIETFSIKFGQKRVFWLCIGTLMMAYGGAIVFGLYSSSLINKVVAVLSHFSVAFILLNKALRIDVTNKEATLPFYLFIWKLLCTEYFLIPFMR